MLSPFIVVSTYRELANLPKLTELLGPLHPPARILLVNDASGDGTPAWVKAHPRYQGFLFLLERAVELGLTRSHRQQESA